MTRPDPASHSLTRVCPNCNGFATVAVTSGHGRDHYGHLRTVTVDCSTCHGAGTRTVRCLRASDWEVVA